MRPPQVDGFALITLGRFISTTKDRGHDIDCRRHGGRGVGRKRPFAPVVLGFECEVIVLAWRQVLNNDSRVVTTDIRRRQATDVIGVRIRKIL